MEKAVLIWSLFLMVVGFVQTAQINLTFLHTAVPKGAVCLDRSAPAYSYTEGYGDGSSSWMIYLQGGGWCYSVENCITRAKSALGSSHLFPEQTDFNGILDLDPSFNPNFYNWHKVFIYYCDGASFMADIEHSASNLTFRGARIFKVMMEEFLSKGMKNAQNAMLTGSSAGGLATTLHCDRFRALFPHHTRVKCVSDSGFFIHGEGLLGFNDNGVSLFSQVVAIHELNNSLPTSCTNKLDPSLCLYPKNFVGEIETPVFLVESAFDAYQVQFTLVPYVGGTAWGDCLQNFASCNSTKLEFLRDFRAGFIETLLKLDHSENRGMFVHSFYRHGHIILRNGWTCSSVYGNNILANKTIGEAVGDWYYDRGSFVTIDAQNDIPRNSLDNDTDILDQRCLATLSSVDFEWISSNRRIQ